MQDFVVVIQDPCSATTFVTKPNPLSDLSIQLTSTTTSELDLPVSVKTSFEVDYNIACDFTASITPTVPGVYLTPDSRIIKIDQSVLRTLIPDSVKSTTFTLAIESVKFPKLVPAVTLDWTLAVSFLDDSVGVAEVSETTEATAFEPEIQVAD